MNDPERV